MSRFMSMADIAADLEVPPSTVKKWRQRGLLPPAIVLPKGVRWRREVIEAWLEERTEQTVGKEVVAFDLRRSSRRSNTRS